MAIVKDFVFGIGGLLILGLVLWGYAILTGMILGFLKGISRILYYLAGLLLIGLPIAGIIYWVITDGWKLIVGLLLCFLFILIAPRIPEILDALFPEPEEEYRKALDRLENNPTDINLRTDALYKGRLYYSKLRENGELTASDELAIQNDINMRISQ